MERKSSGEIIKDAVFLSSKFSYLKVLSSPDQMKRLLSLYTIQAENQKTVEWSGATIKEILEGVDEGSNKSLLTNLKQQLFDKLGQDWIEELSQTINQKQKHYRLTVDAFNAISNLLDMKAGFFDFFESPVPLDEFQRNLLKIDPMYYITRAMRIVDWYEDIYRKPIDLLTLADDLRVKPPELIKVIKPYAWITAKTSGTPSDRNKYFIIKPGEPRFKGRFLRRCDDMYICQYLCHRCGRTTVEMTVDCRKVAEKLRNIPPPFVTHGTLVRTIDDATIYIGGGVLAAFIAIVISSQLLQPFSWNLMFFNAFVILSFFFTIGWSIARKKAFIPRVFVKGEEEE
ncbi:MAG: hypothetical protein ACFFD4_28130 [Candidatus Odinarchaeota archaeon]